ncbi:MAG: hypothetical protein ACXITR_07915 [Cyanobacterium sp.]
MLPTLFGRWQTRLFLLATVGVIFSLPFYFGLGGHGGDLAYFLVVLYVAIFGIFWDILYDYLQKFLWDHDWPGILQLGAGVMEGLFLVLMIRIIGLPGIDGESFDLLIFMAHYGLVWLSNYICAWVLMRLLFTSWRFRGGEWFGKWVYKD